jgi:glutamyl-tRNA synthetase
MTPAVTRFAPSPTGSLHVGGARTALYCWLWARRTSGRFVLRIEDTDQVRSTDEATRGILRDMRWLGLTWDEGPEVGGPAGSYLQSQRLPRYNAVLDQLLASGRAYEAYDSSEELEAWRREAEAEKRTFRYRRGPPTPEEVAQHLAEGRRPVVRLRATERAVTIDDVVVGPVTVEADQLDDLVLRKADGFPTYHFAVVVDDADMAITQVLRGQEHLMNTHKHALIAEAMGVSLPSVGHLPTIFNTEGGKMSKRDKARAARAAARAWLEGGQQGLAAKVGLPESEVDSFVAGQHDGVATAEAVARALGVALPMIEVMDFRRAGYLPEALLNYLALLGWRAAEEGGGEGDRELFTLDELVAGFELGRIKKTAARFDPVKLAWFNKKYLETSPLDRLEAVFSAWLEVVESPLAALSPADRRALLAMYQGRVGSFVELEAAAAPLLTAPSAYGPEKIVKKNLGPDGLDRLAEARRALAELGPWEAEAIEACVADLSARSGVGMGGWAQPLRLALTGGPVSPAIGPTLAFLPRDEVLRRLASCLAHFGRSP